MYVINLMIIYDVVNIFSMKNYKSSRKLRVGVNWYPGVNWSTTTTVKRYVIKSGAGVGVFTRSRTSTGPFLPHPISDWLFFVYYYLHLSQKNASAAFEKLNRCLDDVKEWMSTSKLKLNPDKTEFIIFGSKRQLDKLKACFPINILGNSLCPADSVKNLGVWFDSDFSLSKHVQNVCKSCFVKLRDFRHVRRFLTHDVSVLVANALVSSRLDYCNSLNRSLSKFNQRKLQCIQNSAARIVSNTCRYTSITPVLKKLHWLHVEQRTVFKTATLVYKYLHTGFPRYFAPYLSSYSSSYSTRRSQSGGNFLVIPKFCPSVHKSVKQFGDSFAFDAPTVWNALRFVPLPRWPPSEGTSKVQNPPVHQSIPTIAWIIPLAFSVVLDPCYAPGY